MTLLDKSQIKATEIYYLHPSKNFKVDLTEDMKEFVESSLEFMRQLAVRVQADRESPTFMYLREMDSHIVARRSKDDSWIVAYYEKMINPFKINSLLSIHV